MVLYTLYVIFYYFCIIVLNLGVFGVAYIYFKVLILKGISLCRNWISNISLLLKY